MNVLVIGSGGREHALVWKLAKSPLLAALYCAPGNPGIAELANRVPIKAHEIEKLCTFAESAHIDLTVVGPEQPLAEGLVDRFESKGLKIFGPTRQASRLEWSKAFAKEFMTRHSIPTAGHRTFTAGQRREAEAFIERLSLPVVLKADGLAAGKGVVICHTVAAAHQTLGEMWGMRAFGSAGETIVVEEFLQGEEASVFAVCDGRDYVLLAAAQDHKRVFDGDEGKNTGGMGAYAPAPIVTSPLLLEIEHTIIRPTLAGMSSEGSPYKGCLYVGLMIGPDGAKVVEYNCRFGDPETQAVLPLYNGDFLALLLAAANGSLATISSSCSPASNLGSCVCVVLASGGYPDSYKSGYEIQGLEKLRGMDDIIVFHAGTDDSGGRPVTAGGRVLGVTSMQQTPSLADAIRRAYEAVGKISFEGMHYRHDIGRKGLLEPHASVKGNRR